MNYRSSLIAIFVVVFAFGCRGRNDSRSEFLSAGPSSSMAVGMREFALPIKEASGLSHYVDPQTGRRQILVVNDSDKKLLMVDYEKMRQGDLSFGGFDLGAMSRQQSQPAEASSQWEAVFADTKGCVYISNEEASTFEIFDLVQKTRVGLIELKIPSDDESLGDLKTSWEQDPGSRVEGFIILPNGHILAVKEKNPPLLIEFAPQGEKAAGVKVDGSLMNPSSDARQSELNSGINWPGRPDNKFVYHAKKIWSPASDYPADLDISELAYTDRGELALLSDRLQTIFVIGSELSLTERTFKIKEKLVLPSTAEKPEGLLFMPGSKVLIASDLQELKPNLFWISWTRK
jgi:hypothetical protein